VNLDPLECPETTVSQMLRTLRDKLAGISDKLKKSFVWGSWEYEKKFGDIQDEDVESIPSGKWEITKVRTKTTGFADLKVKTKKYDGVIRIDWELYRNGSYRIQAISDSRGFEMFNRTPNILPPDINIEPGTYVCRASALRKIVLTITDYALTLDYVDCNGFIVEEIKAGYQLRGRRLYLNKPFTRWWVKGCHQFPYGEWIKKHETAHSYPVKKNSEVELELLIFEGPKKFLKEIRPIVKGSKGYAYKGGERVKGFRVSRLNRQLNQDENGPLGQEK